VYWVTERRHLQSAFSWRGLTLVMAISSTRNMVLFIVVWMEDLEERLSQLYPQIRQAVPRKQRLLALTLVPVLLLIGLSVYALSRQTPDPERNMPYQAVAYLQAHPCQGHIFNDYGYGGYLIWRLPSTPVYIDGRMPSWETNGTTWVQRYNKVQTDVSFRETEFKNYNITCALLIRQSIGQELYKWLQDQGWEVKIKTDHSVLLVKPS
jgi:hypothetical protein